MTAKDAAALAREYNRNRSIRAEMIEDGEMPTTRELFEGHAFAKRSIEYDARLFFKREITERGEDNPDIATAAAREIVDAGYDIRSITQARTAYDVVQDVDGVLRCLIYISCTSDAPEARGRLIAHLGFMTRREPHIASSGAALHLALVQIGLASGHESSMYDYLRAGIDRVRECDIGIGLLHPGQRVKGEIADDVDEDVMDLLALVSEDRAEFGTVSARKKTTTPRIGSPLGVVVVPDLGAASSTAARRDTAKLWHGIAGKHLPLVRRGDIVEQRAALVDRWPHAEPVIDAILADVAGDERLRFRPTILVGPPGSGKSALARALGEAVGMPVEVVPLAGVADGSVMGTSAQWSTSRESVPLQLIRRSKCANPLIVWDEIDKTVDSHNGSTTGALLPMLEPSTARAIRDPALEVECDLSWISHLATANDLDGIPAPLRDRMRILRMPEPTWQHAGVLIRGIVDDITLERGLDRRWFGTLDGDEVELVRRQWRGGSIRRLRRIVEVVVEGRQVTWGRA